MRFHDVISLHANKTELNYFLHSLPLSLISLFANIYDSTTMLCTCSFLYCLRDLYTAGKYMVNNSNNNFVYVLT